MIASLHGKLESLGGDWAIIDVNGVGFQVHMPFSTINTLGVVGSETHLHTELILREDGAFLYGFATTEELELFQVLISVSGLGPRLALATLSTMSAGEANMAISTGNIALLVTVPGIGKRMAERIIVELKDKVSAGLIAATAQYTEENADVIAAMTSLGYSVAEASHAVNNLPHSDISLEEKIKLALQYFSSK